MSKRVLVTYATKYGATAGIADKIGAVLSGAGFEADVRPADQAGDPAAYDAVVLGSAVYAGSWRKEAVTFLEGNAQALAARPTWFFSSGPAGEGDPVTLMKGWRFPEAQEELAASVAPRDKALFSGVLDMHKLNLGEKLIMKAMKAPAGDFRDWPAITAWAEGIAATLA